MLVIRTRAKHYELPKGHLEGDETHAAAALRELREETGLVDAPAPLAELGELAYRFGGDPPVRKRVRYFLFAVETPDFGPLPPGTRERRWISRAEVAALPLRHENLRPLLAEVLRQPG